ncbi:MAG: translational GTPase TypA [Alphaproteobacteria bacterium]
MIELRNIAIIAHVDHGKTTLVDCLLQQSGAVEAHRAISERAMDSNDLEKERGITILAKCTSVRWQEVKINIVDTPGHADFGGEVERILSMVDSALLLVDAAEGPMPQTKFVLMKALEQGLKPIVVINKVDRPDARPDWVIDQCFDLFIALGASDEQCDFPILYASGKQGWAASTLEDERKDMHPLLDLILSHVAPPVVEMDAPLKLLSTTLESDVFLGRILTGRVYQGSIETGQTVQVLRTNPDNGKHEKLEQARLTKLFSFNGLERVQVDRVQAGDIVAIAGLVKATVADTICDLSIDEALPARPITPPTMSLTLSVNDSPLAGREGNKLTSRMLLDRLMKEAEGNVAIRVTMTEDRDAYEVAGRGELQLGVLIETLRREGFEMTVGPPRVIFREDEKGKILEPIEEAHIDVDEAFAGIVMEKLGPRKGELKDIRPSGGGKQRLVIEIPSRGLIGYQGEFLSDTKGTGILSRIYHGHFPHKGVIPGRRAGVLISGEQGKASAYALFNLEERGDLFVDPNDEVYVGMIIGEHNKGQDLEVNPLKSKQLTNFRASGKDDAIKLTPPFKRGLENAMAYIEEDERLEVTPKNLRLRKAILDPHERKRATRKTGG